MESNFYIFNFICISLINIFFYLIRNKLYKYIDLVDNPDGKLKNHKNKTFVIGGFIFFLTIVYLFILILFEEKNLNLYIGNNYFERTALLFGFVGMFFIGFYDDKFNLNYKTKLILSILILYVCLTLDQSLIITELKFTFTNKIFFLRDLDKFFTIFCILLFINALNLFDGIDLQSGLYILFLSLLLAFNYNINFFVFLIIPCLLFLYLNSKKEIFLGDSGTILLGFIFSYFFIKLYNFSNIKSDEIFILMMIPGIDMMRLFFLRIIGGKNPFKGDRSHIHHILLSKYNHLKTVILIQSLIIIPFLIFLIFKVQSILIILISLMIYFILISKK